MPLLEVDRVDVFYGAIQALRGVSLHVDAGERVALVGANGAGKTTTLRTISGLLSPKKGEITFNQENISGLPAYTVVGKGVAHGPEGRALFPTLSVEENLRFGYLPQLKAQDGAYKNPLRRAGATAKRFLGAKDRAYATQLEKVFTHFPRLKERRKQSAATLSGGEQQMLVMARALMSSPKLLIMDELSLGLAPKIVSLLFEILREVNRDGAAVLIVEQFVHMALENTDRAYVLAKGQVVAEGASKELLDSPELMAAYLGEVDGHASTSGEEEDGGQEEEPAATKRGRARK